jgi:hypothetical protein
MTPLTFSNSIFNRFSLFRAAVFLPFLGNTEQNLAETFKQYCNARHGFCVNYPDFLKKDKPPENGVRVDASFPKVPEDSYCNWSLFLFCVVSVGFFAGGHGWTQSLNYLSRLSFPLFLTSANTTIDNFPFFLTCHQWRLNANTS